MLYGFIIQYYSRFLQSLSFTFAVELQEYIKNSSAIKFLGGKLEEKNRRDFFLMFVYMFLMSLYEQLKVTGSKRCFGNFHGT